MSEQTIAYDCASCGASAEVPMGDQDEYTVGGQLYCETCLGPTEWESQDFPVWIQMEAYHDNYELGRAVERKTGIDLEDIPIAQDLKYCVFYSWWKITESGVEGPYDAKRGEKR